MTRTVASLMGQQRRVTFVKLAAFLIVTFALVTWFNKPSSNNNFNNNTNNNSSSSSTNNQVPKRRFQLFELSSTDVNRDPVADSTTRAAMNDGELAADDPRVLSYIRRHISRPRRGLALNLADKSVNKSDFSLMRSSRYIDRLLKRRRDGFFVECGAADGETVANSLFFELRRNWTGLLIEANPTFFERLLTKHRNALALHACLSTERIPRPIRYKTAGLSGGIASEMTKVQLSVGFVSSSPEIDVMCFPLNSILDAIGVDHVDFMSLDVEGAEPTILRTVDWRRLRIDVIMVEYTMIGINPQTGFGVAEKLEKLESIRRAMLDSGLYREVGLFPEGSSPTSGHDVVFERV